MIDKDRIGNCKNCLDYKKYCNEYPCNICKLGSLYRRR